jgi:hypothetical protein
MDDSNLLRGTLLPWELMGCKNEKIWIEQNIETGKAESLNL